VFSHGIFETKYTPFLFQKQACLLTLIGELNVVSQQAIQRRLHLLLSHAESTWGNLLAV
jgi:hypothetical protein